MTAAFTVFLHEADRHGKEGPPSTTLMSDTELQAIIIAIADLAFQHFQVTPDAPLTDVLARVVFLATAPFLGTADAAVLGQHGTPTACTADGRAAGAHDALDPGPNAA